MGIFITLYVQSQTTVLPKPRKVEEKVHPPFEVVGRSELLKAIRDGKCTGGYVRMYVFAFLFTFIYIFSLFYFLVIFI